MVSMKCWIKSDFRNYLTGTLEWYLSKDCQIVSLRKLLSASVKSSNGVTVIGAMHLIRATIPSQSVAFGDLGLVAEVQRAFNSPGMPIFQSRSRSDAFNPIKTLSFVRYRCQKAASSGVPGFSDSFLYSVGCLRCM